MLISCNGEIVNDVVDTDVDIFVEDSEGHNLLNNALSNAINLDSVRLAYLVNGKEFEFYNANLDCPRSFCPILDEAGKERIQIFPNDSESEAFPITYIRWRQGDVDTLKCHFVRKSTKSESSLVCDRVWFNGEAVYPEKTITGFNRAFRIVK